MKSILIVDDELDILEILAEVLGARYHVKVATNGEEALDVVAAAPPIDAIVLDLMMPVMDGSSFVHEMRRRGLKIPILLVSAVRDLPVRAAELGVEGCCAKPCSPAVLEAALTKIFAA